MFNVLFRHEVPGVEDVRGTLDDPFYRIVNFVSGYRWADKHLVIEDDQIVGVK